MFRSVGLNTCVCVSKIIGHSRQLLSLNLPYMCNSEVEFGRQIRRMRWILFVLYLVRGRESISQKSRAKLSKIVLQIAVLFSINDAFLLAWPKRWHQERIILTSLQKITFDYTLRKILLGKPMFSEKNILINFQNMFIYCGFHLIIYILL